MRKAVILTILIFILSGFSFNINASEKNDLALDRYTSIGVYTGMIDDNSVEIKINNKAMAFRLTEGTSKYFEGKIINENIIVTIIYYKNEYGQLVLQNIKKSLF